MLVSSLTRPSRLLAYVSRNQLGGSAKSLASGTFYEFNAYDLSVRLIMIAFDLKLLRVAG
jgi:hypothetical protein